MIFFPIFVLSQWGINWGTVKNHNCSDSYPQAVAKHCYFNNGRETENSLLLVVTINKKTVQW